MLVFSSPPFLLPVPFSKSDLFFQNSRSSAVPHALNLFPFSVFLFVPVRRDCYGPFFVKSMEVLERTSHSRAVPPVVSHQRASSTAVPWRRYRRRQPDPRPHRTENAAGAARPSLGVLAVVAGERQSNGQPHFAPRESRQGRRTASSLCWRTRPPPSTKFQGSSPPEEPSDSNKILAAHQVLSQIR